MTLCCHFGSPGRWAVGTDEDARRVVVNVRGVPHGFLHILDLVPHLLACCSSVFLVVPQLISSSQPTHHGFRKARAVDHPSESAPHTGSSRPEPRKTLAKPISNQIKIQAKQ